MCASVTRCQEENPSTSRGCYEARGHQRNFAKTRKQVGRQPRPGPCLGFVSPAPWLLDRRAQQPSSENSPACTMPRSLPGAGSARAQAPSPGQGAPRVCGTLEAATWGQRHGSAWQPTGQVCVPGLEATSLSCTAAAPAPWRALREWQGQCSRRLHPAGSQWRAAVSKAGVSHGNEHIPPEAGCAGHHSPEPRPSPELPACCHVLHQDRLGPCRTAPQLRQCRLRAWSRPGWPSQQVKVL